MTDTNTNNDLFSSLYQDTESSIGAMTKGPVDVSVQLEALEAEMQEVKDIADDSERAKREEILATKFDTLREAVKTDEQDMAKAVYGMKVLIDGMDEEFQGLISFSKAEEQVIADAESDLEKAKLAKSQAETNLTDVENESGLFAWFGKDGRITEAKKVLTTSKTKLATAVANIDKSKIQADELKRERLMSADISDTLNLIQVMGEKTVSIMRDRTKSIQSSLEAIKARKAKAFEIKNEATQRTNDLLGQVETLENTLRNEELATDSFEVGSNERAVHDEKVSNMRSELETLRGDLKVAQAVLDEKTKSIQEHEAFELGQEKLLSNHRMWIATLQSKLQEDLVKDAAYLEMLQSAADQEIAQNVDGMSDEKNARQMENVAKIIVSSDQAYMEKMDRTPEEIRRRANVVEALAQHKSNLSEDEAKLRQHYIDNYNIDPLHASQFTHSNTDETNNGSNPVENGQKTDTNESAEVFG